MGSIGFGSFFLFYRFNVNSVVAALPVMVVLFCIDMKLFTQLTFGFICYTIESLPEYARNKNCCKKYRFYITLVTHSCTFLIYLCRFAT